MQIDPARKRMRVGGGGKATELMRAAYPYWINFYTSAPDFKITLQEIEEMVADRLMLLQEINKMLNADTAVKRNKNFYSILKGKLESVKKSSNSSEKHFFFLSQFETETDPCKMYEARKRDHISHYLLRIYYCQSAELRKWYVNRETELFRYRLTESSMTNASTTSCELQECLKYYGYDYDIVDCVQQEMHDRVSWMEFHNNHLTRIVFKMHFLDALELIRSRRVYLEGGYAYIPAPEMVSVLCAQFRANLSRDLARMHTDFEFLDEERLIQRLDALHRSYITEMKSEQSAGDASQSRYSIQPDQIDALAEEFFPPCMRSIHESLRRDHHLKHYGRLHYGLFLKSAGLSLENSIEFFGSELSTINPQKFQKEYTYTLRYIYGKEGKRVNLSAYSCNKIITGCAPGPTDTHGCPFKHFDEKHLKSMLLRYGVNDAATLEEIVRLAKEENDMGGACSKYFTSKHGEVPGGKPIDSIYHPNEYFKVARQLRFAPQMPSQQQQQQEGEQATQEEGNDVSLCNTTINSIDEGANLFDDTLDEEFDDLPAGNKN